MKLSSRNKAMLPAMIFCIIGAVFYLRFGAIILLLTIVPSIVAYFVDHSEGRPMFKIVSACNLSAALPFIVQIVNFSLKKQYAEAGQVVDDPRVWAFIYFGAAAGYGMLFLAKLVARVVTLMQYDYKMNILEKKQELLVKEWGEEISTPAAAKSKRNR
jgi:hypothetical protein